MVQIGGSVPSHEVCNLVIATLAYSEHALARDLAGCREALHAVLEQLHERDGQLERQRRQHRRLRDEYRHFRETTFRDERRVAA